MQLSKSVSSAALATAAALLFSVASFTTASADEAKVHCDGVNSCKGQSSCKGAILGRVRTQTSIQVTSCSEGTLPDAINPMRYRSLTQEACTHDDEAS
jgi:hypothetical protein